MDLFRQSAEVATSFWKYFQPQRRWKSGLTAQRSMARARTAQPKKPVIYSGSISMCPFKSSSVLDRIMMFQLPLTGVCLKWWDRPQWRLCSTTRDACSVLHHHRVWEGSLNIQQISHTSLLQSKTSISLPTLHRIQQNLFCFVFRAVHIGGLLFYQWRKVEPQPSPIYSK